MITGEEGNSSNHMTHQDVVKRNNQQSSPALQTPCFTQHTEHRSHGVLTMAVPCCMLRRVQCHRQEEVGRQTALQLQLQELQSVSAGMLLMCDAILAACAQQEERLQAVCGARNIGQIVYPLT
jgi:hypothetical protein